MSLYCTVLQCNVLYCMRACMQVSLCAYISIHIVSVYMYLRPGLNMWAYICIYIYMHTDHAETSSPMKRSRPEQIPWREANIFLQDFPSINLFLFPGPFYMGIISSAGILMDLGDQWIYVDEIHVIPRPSLPSLSIQHIHIYIYRIL